jgi:hypothetical protein
MRLIADLKSSISLNSLLFRIEDVAFDFSFVGDSAFKAASGPELPA